MDKSRALSIIPILIRKAVDAGATKEEARSAAHQACMLIHEHDLKVSDGFLLAPPAPVVLNRATDAQRRWPEAGATPRGRVVRNLDRRAILAASAGFCFVCDDAYRKGERVVFFLSKRKISHVACASDYGREPDIR